MLGTLSLPSQPSLLLPRRVSVRTAVSELGHSSSSTAAAAANKSLYEVLRVKHNASQTEIKTAYRTLAKLYHPDATSRFMDSSVAKEVDESEGEDFIEIHKAYETLSDPDARAVYDSNLNLISPRDWNRMTGFRSSGRVRFYQTRRWETDQCW